MTTAVSYATEIWLAELAQAGWELTISEQRRLYVDDLGAFTERETVGVLATRLQDVCEGSGVFVPCSSEGEARRLLERIEQEIGGV